MPAGEGNYKSTGAIRVRAEQLAARGGQDTAEAELLAAIADGTLSFEEIDDDLLARCIDAFGPDFVIEAFLHPADDYRAANIQMDQGEALEKPEEAGTVYAAVSKESRKSRFVGAWRTSRLSWVAAAAAAAVIVVGTVVFLATRTKTGQPEQTVAKNNLSLQWPSQPPFDPYALKKWGLPNVPLPKELPNFKQEPSTLGATGIDRFAPWQLATVIVRSENGWGSGAFISRKGWLLSSYRVVAGAAQAAAVTGRPAKLDVIAARIADGRAKPQPALKATLYRVDPVHDLALLKLDSLPVGQKGVPFFRLAPKVRDGDDCFVIGPAKNGPAWAIRSGNVTRQFDYPEHLRPSAAGVATANTAIDRHRARVIVTDVRLLPGDSGGPLLNSTGELIGLALATPANTRAGSGAWYIALPQLRDFTQDLPAEPEGAPFDPWTAGLPEAMILQPELVDADHDGRTDSLLYRYASPAGTDSKRGSPQPLAVTVFADLAERTARTGGTADLVPYGLWGMENRGGFRFDLFATVRADHLTAVGYTNPEGVVHEIRIGTAADGAIVLWKRNVDGKWDASQPPTATPLIDSKRFGGTDLGRLQAILRQFLGDSSGRLPSTADGSPAGGADRLSPNGK